MNLIFPVLNGGPIKGLNDAGVENFQGPVDEYLVRECGQNSSDAPNSKSKTVRLEFSKIFLKPDEIPGFDELKTALYSSYERWKKNSKEEEFFRTAIEMANREEIPVLRIADFGTTGLTGDDTDENGRWLPLVKSEGVSNKGDTAGGSFGIGKSSPFAASRFRTVFYGTLTEQRSVALQGVTKLVTHKNSEGKLTQGVGYIGELDPSGGEGGDPVFRAVRDGSLIPEQFRRDDVGTDIWVIGYRSGDEWQDRLVRSILENFWPAIHFGKISFKVGESVIDKENLSGMIEKYSSEVGFSGHHYFKAIANQPIKKTLSSVGACELYLTTLDPNLPRKICMVRSNGMRIFYHEPRACRVPFGGLFICTDDVGNKLLRKLEPPRHDKWEHDRVEGPLGKRALDEIKIWIREEVKKLNPLFSGSAFNETELAKYLADDDPDDADDLPSESNGLSEEPDLDPRPKKDDIPVEPLSVVPITALPEKREKTGGASGNKGKGGGAGGAGGSGESRPGQNDDEVIPNLRLRSYYSGNRDRYQLVLRSDDNYSGKIQILAIGEDGKGDPVSIVDVQEESGKNLTILGGNTIDGVSIDPQSPLRLDIKIDALERRALTVVGKL